MKLYRLNWVVVVVQLVGRLLPPAEVNSSNVAIVTTTFLNFTVKLGRISQKRNEIKTDLKSFCCQQFKLRAVVVAQLVERSLPIP